MAVNTRKKKKESRRDNNVLPAHGEAPGWIQEACGKDGKGAGDGEGDGELAEALHDAELNHADKEVGENHRGRAALEEGHAGSDKETGA